MYTVVPGLNDPLNEWPTGLNDPLNKWPTAIYNHFFIHVPLSHAIWPVSNDLLADATNNLYIVTKTPQFTLYQWPDNKLTKQTLAVNHWSNNDQLQFENVHHRRRWPYQCVSAMALLLLVRGTFHWLITKSNQSNLTVLASLHDLLDIYLVLGLLLVITNICSTPSMYLFKYRWLILL